MCAANGCAKEQVMSCKVKGLICLHAKQPKLNGEQCQCCDYKVRYLCPGMLLCLIYRVVGMFLYQTETYLKTIAINLITIVCHVWLPIVCWASVWNNKSPKATYKWCGRPKGQPKWSVGRPIIFATKEFIWYQVINISKCHCFNWGLVTPHGDMTLLTMCQLMASCFLAPNHCK